MSLMKFLRRKRSSAGDGRINRIEIKARESGKGKSEVARSASSAAIDEEKKRLATPLNPKDFFKVEDALMLIAEDQPTVARSTPKNLIPDTSRLWSEREMAHCLYDRPFYDAMIKNSLKTCAKLQESLDSYVVEVRKSSSCTFGAKN